jgi:CMP-N-acetylneuraminic acid synthetase
MTVLGLVPARGGSKGIPGKNLRLLRGRPLIAYTALAALAARRLSRVALSTDDAAIARAGREAGLEVPFMRPAALALDATPMLAVVRHALQWFIAQGTRFDAVCLLQPTSPLRQPGIIDRCIDLLDASNADAVMTVRPIPAEHHPFWAFLRAEDGSMRLSTGAQSPIARRQDLPEAFHRDGAVYVTRSDVVLDSNTMYGRRTVGCVVDSDDNVNLDTHDDWRRAEALLAAGGL